uniref:Uncharacterized protein n=1 Tax=Odontella aurita TaxID=265563 RepID=A0A7S4M5Z0_9STRA|mmetsp:Transcript_12047/g.35174  ORF Transcript_12047/g.35174 Transcript_12047/m.35174 type:complete len:198 (+) Transcript_12047:136-729(+)
MCQWSALAMKATSPALATTPEERRVPIQNAAKRLREVWNTARRNPVFGSAGEPSSPEDRTRSASALSTTSCSAANADVEGLRRTLATRRMEMSDASVETARAMHYSGVKMGQSGLPENEFEAISALEEALERIQDALGPGDEESAVVAHNLWVLLHNVKVRHEKLMKEKEAIETSWKEGRRAGDEPANAERRRTMWL